MASLIKPINRCLGIFRKANMAMAGIRFNSSDKPSTGKMDTPIQKEALDPNADPKETYMANPWDLLYGAEKFEIAMKSKGYDDPYDMEPLKRKAVSSKVDPNIVQTLADQRVVGCICEADTHHINFMWISKGETKRCECGHWFKCVERELPDLSDYGLHLEKHAHH